MESNVSFEEVVANLRGLEMCNYSSIGALTFTIHDMISSMEGEVKQIWMKKRSNLKLLYLFMRVISLSSQVIATGITLRLTAGAPDSLRVCQMLAAFQGAAAQVLMMAVQIILMLRVQALYYEQTYLKHLLRGLFLAEQITMTVLFGFAMPHMKYGVHCVVTSFPSLAAGFFIPPIIFESFLFVLTMIKFYRAVREGWGQESIMTRFLKDGIWAFALPFAILTLNTFCTAFLPGATSSVVYSWAIAVPGFAGCRLILNMSHLLKINHTTLPQRSTDGQVMDTLYLTNGMLTGLTTDTNTHELRDFTHIRA